MEIKTSWVELKNENDYNNYITIEAEVPTYDKTSETIWTPTGKHVTKKTCHDRYACCRKYSWTPRNDMNYILT